MGSPRTMDHFYLEMFVRLHAFFCINTRLLLSRKMTLVRFLNVENFGLPRILYYEMSYEITFGY